MVPSAAGRVMVVVGDEQYRVISSWPDAQKFGAAIEKFPWSVRAPPAPSPRWPR